MKVSDIGVHPEVVPGVTIGPWLIRERWARGSFGIIFRVERAGHPEAGPFALKIALTPDDPRFKREITLLQSLHHPSVPRFEDRGWWTSSSGDQYPYLAMEWVEGVPLYAWGRQRTSREVLQALAQIASALAAAHAAGGVHRDVKGDNILVQSDGRAVLLDWGCCIHSGASELTDGPLGPGTMAYRSPESLRWYWARRGTGGRYEPAGPDDIYALGVTAYRLCTGTYPPPLEEASGPPRRIPPPRELTTVSQSLDLLVMDCLGEAPHRRPAAAALVVALRLAAERPGAQAAILPTPAEADPNRGSYRGLRVSLVLPDWLPIAGGALAALAVLVWGIVTIHAPHPSVEVHIPPLPAEGWKPPDVETPDAGVAEEALVSVEDVPRAVLPALSSLGRPMPTNPFPGQKKPPCDPRTQRVINGACWVGPIGAAKPPCGSEAYDGEDGCYVPFFISPRQPTSDQP